MKFEVGGSVPPPAERERNTVYLWPTGWDDWFQFSTSHVVSYVNATGDVRQIGITKIGQFGLLSGGKGTAKERGRRSPDLPTTFTQLDDRFFSLGQDTSYYETLSEIGNDFREEFLRALKDIAADPALRARAEEEPVTQVSLLRDVPLKTVEDQFHRLAYGGARLTDYEFHFVKQAEGQEPVRFDFSVKHGSRPPTNIHVLIGRNGVGKSTLLNGIARTVVSAAQGSSAEGNGPYGIKQLSNVISVSFSAFDAFEPISVPRDRTKGVTYHYVGLKKVGAKNQGDDSPVSDTKDSSALSREMSVAARTCLRGARRDRWLEALRLLEGDPIFASIGLVDLIQSSDDEEAVLDQLPGVFRRLSSGHKIVLLTTTKLVETIEEKSLVLLDEPEAHLHPPLLSAFVRALSNLLTNRNGVAIVATHSPVVLQEVPRSCVWKLQRMGEFVSAERPQIETFGENVGVLTDDVFGLEVSATGFHKMLADAAAETGTYEQALDRLGGQLGAEGRAILRSMILFRSSNVAR